MGNMGKRIQRAKRAIEIVSTIEWVAGTVAWLWKNRSTIGKVVASLIGVGGTVVAVIASLPVWFVIPLPVFLFAGTMFGLERYERWKLHRSRSPRTNNKAKVLLDACMFGQNVLAAAPGVEQEDDEWKKSLESFNAQLTSDVAPVLEDHEWMTVRHADPEDVPARFRRRFVA